MTGRAGLTENEARKRLADRINGKNDDINNLKVQVQDLSSDIQEIKSLLASLLQQSK
jgi:uncharacterized protein YoxC